MKIKWLLWLSDIREDYTVYYANKVIFMYGGMNMKKFIKDNWKSYVFGTIGFCLIALPEYFKGMKDGRDEVINGLIANGYKVVDEAGNVVTNIK